MDPKGSRKLYFPRKVAEDIKHLDAREVHLILTKGKQLIKAKPA